MFETPPTTSPPEKVSMSIWASRMENLLILLEMNMHHLINTQLYISAIQNEMVGDLKDIKSMMDNLLSRYPPP
jgi:hypothetical protein